VLSRAHGRAAGQNKGRPELADIFRHYGERYRKTHCLPAAHRKVMRAVEVCRTAELGGHLKQCDTCGFEHPSYNSCRNRHCPKCQSLAKAQWLQEQSAELLPVGYFHLVFTLPHLLNGVILAHKKFCSACCLKPSVKRCLSLAEHALVERWGSSPCCTPGIKLSTTIFTCTVLSPPGLCLWIRAAGLQHGQTFCFRSRR
jgi:predicted Zn-ribbon and HTH transcriptional regulator